jgi:hypothetical protein
MATIRSEILKDKNTALAEFKNQQFEVRPDVDDNRRPLV